MNQKSLHFADYTTREIADFEKDFFALHLPLGCTEQQGYQLPIKTDTLHIEALVLEGIKKTEGRVKFTNLLLPSLPYGPASEHIDFPGTISLSFDTHNRIIKEVVNSLVRHGFRTFFLWKGCGGHIVRPPALELTRYWRDQNVKIRIFDPNIDFFGAACSVFNVKPDSYKSFHADQLTTSLQMYIEGEKSVRKSYLKDLDADKEPNFEEAWIISDVLKTGAGGFLSQASKDKGKKIFEEITNQIAKKIIAIEERK